MSEQDEELLELCPDCGEELWYDGAAGCWVCEGCGAEFDEADWDDEEWEDEDEEEDAADPPQGAGKQ